MSSLLKYFAASVVIALAGSAFTQAAVQPGEPFPDLAAQGLEGKLPSLAGRVVLVDFWASWCSPCKESFPVYAAWERELSAQGFTLVAVSVDKKASDYASFVKRLAPPFTTMRDASQSLVAKVEPPAMPTCYLIDRSGRVRSVHTGYHGLESAQALRREIETLLKEDKK